MQESRSGSIINLKDLNFFFKIVKKNWWIIVLFFGLAFTFYSVYIYKLPVIYSSTTEILLQSNDEYNPSSLISDDFGGYYGNTMRTYIDNSNESRVIRSYDLISRVLSKLDFDVSYYIVGRVKSEEVYSGVPFRVKTLHVHSGMYERTMKFKFLNEKEFMILYNKGEEEFSLKGKFGEDVTGSDFKINISASNGVNSITVDNFKKIEYQFIMHEHFSLVSRYQSLMEVKNPEYTNILQVSIQDVITERAIKFLDSLSKEYIRNTLATRYEINEKTMFYIDKQMKEVISVLDEIEDTMQLFKEEKAILDLVREGDAYFDKLNAYEAQKTGYQLEIMSLDDLEKYIIEDKDPKFLPPSIYVLSGDAFLQKRTTDLYSRQISRNIALGGSTQDNPSIVEAGKEISLIKQDLLVYIGNLRKAIKDRIKEVEQKINEFVVNIKKLPVKQRGLTNIQRKLSVNESMYVFLLQKRASTIIARATIIPQTKVIESARIGEVVSPDKAKLLNIFLSTGLGIALLLVIIRTLFFEKVESQDDLRSITGLPILGEIYWFPDIGDLGLAIEKDPRSILSEGFRSLRTNLQFFGAGEKAKVVVVSSTSPGEGKTFCTLNLAATLAMAGKKVLILELDLHKPRVQKGLNLEPVKGITTIIIGKDTTEDSIIKTHIENLDVILSGPLPPNPSELILSPKLDEILEFAKMRYDYVFIDTPPIGLISDGFIMMKKADASLFVLNSKIAYRRALQNVIEVIEHNKFSNFAFILNGVKRRRIAYYYKYGYSYRYGYGYYGHDYKDKK